MTQAAGSGRHDNAARYPLEEGVCYLVRGKSADPCYRFAEAQAAAGTPILCVSRTVPERLRMRYDLAGAEMWWITGSPGEGHYDPTAISTLSSDIDEFIDRHPDGSLVVLDGIEYITINVGFEKAVLFLEHLNEFVMPRRATMLVPADPDCYLPMEFARLDRFTGSLSEEELRQMLESSNPE